MDLEPIGDVHEAVTCPGCGVPFTPAALRTHLYDKSGKSYPCCRVAEQLNLEERYRLGAGGWQHRCQVCGVTFYSSGRFARYCGRRACMAEASRLSRALRSARRREQVCRHCQTPFTATRRDARYCRPACRQAHYRDGSAHRRNRPILTSVTDDVGHTGNLVPNQRQVFD
jgi:hypothetical protein